MPIDDLPLISKSFNSDGLAEAMLKRQQWSREVGFQLVDMLNHSGLRIHFGDEDEGYYDDPTADGWCYDYHGQVCIRLSSKNSNHQGLEGFYLNISSSGIAEISDATIDFNNLEPQEAVAKIVLHLAQTEWLPSSLHIMERVNLFQEKCLMPNLSS